jgi:uncharacterized protein YjbI with pentapeptide repeats
MRVEALRAAARPATLRIFSDSVEGPIQLGSVPFAKRFDTLLSNTMLSNTMLSNTMLSNTMLSNTVLSNAVLSNASVGRQSVG